MLSQRRIEIGSHVNHGAPQSARSARFPLRRFGNQQPGNRPIIFSDEQFFARMELMNQFREFGLGFVQGNGGHGCSPVSGDSLERIVPRNRAAALIRYSWG